LKIDPKDLVSAATDALQNRDRDRAVEIMAHLSRFNAPIGDSWETIARLAAFAGETTLALGAQQRFIAENPNDARRHWELCVMMLTFGRTKDAIELSRQLIARAPKVHAFHQLLGNAYAQAGEAKFAMEALRNGLAIDPQVAESWLSYAHVKTFALGDPDIAEMQRIAEAMPAEPKAAAGTMYYALGKALDDAGDADAAFTAFETGARLLSEESSYNRAAAEALVTDVRSGWTSGLIQSLTQSTETTADITFVLGLPRSGTTLAEQIFVSHTAYAEGAETSLFGKAALAFPDLRAETVRAVAGEPRWNGDIWSRIARSYVHLMRDRFGTPTGRFVDKTLTNVNFVGMIAQALPNAKFIWLRREPAAAAWSCFRTCFGGPVDWSWSLANIGHYFRLNDRLFEHWTALLPDRILPVRYEDLVQAPGTHIPRMLAFTGVADEPQTRDFHAAERGVRTASISQVREPLYTSGLSSWRRYEARMQPFFDAYHTS
jgi:tetratricopeptide (TPR) repeat protein